jgi:ribosomal protein S18 acetylase RimI-like enzyme
MQLPPVGTRVMVRYRRPAGSVPPLTDVIGHLLAVEPTLRVRTKRGDVVEVDPADVVAVKALAAAPLRTSEIRATEHAAALAWPGVEHVWLNGWLLRAAGGFTHRGNSAVPLGVEAGLGALPSIIEWYRLRGLTPWLSVPDRLLRLPHPEAHLETVVMVRDLPEDEPDSAVTLAPVPDEHWLRVYERDVPVDVLTAVVDGEVAFATIAGAAVGRGAVTNAPDGSRWVGMSAVRVTEEQRRRGHGRTLCAALLAWGFRHGATRAYVQVVVDNTAGIALYESMGFSMQHRSRYVDARTL